MIISIHVPKTAGIAFRQILIKAFGKNIYFDYGSQYDIVEPYSAGLSESIYSIYKKTKMIVRGDRGVKLADECIHGHFGAKKYQYSFPNAEKIIWLRDPVERIVSHYNYWLRNPDRASPVCMAMHKEKWTLEEFAGKEILTNYQSRFLMGLPLEKFEHVGVQEYYPQCAERIACFLGVESGVVSEENINPSKGVSDKYDIADALRSKIAGLNTKDYEIYDSAMNRLVSQGVI